MKKQIKTSVFLGLSLFLTTGFSALQAWDGFDGLGDGECRWNCCNDGCHLRAAQPCCDEGGFFFGADFLWWTAYHINSDYAVDAEIVATGTTTTTIIPSGNYHHVKSDWQPGFRVDLGYRWGCDGWDTRLVWTRFHTSNSHSLSGDDDESSSSSSSSSSSGSTATTGLLLPTLWPANSILGPEAIASSATGSRKVNYDVVDFLFERPYFVSCTHTLRPFFGVRGVWLHHKFHVDYTGGTDVTDLQDFDSAIGHSSWGSEFEGAGLVAGLGYEMLLCDCISLYADFSGSLIAGQHRNHVNATLFRNVEDETGVTLVDTHERENTLLPGYHIGTGLSWETNICCYCFVFDIGYEFNQWFNTPDFRRFPSNEHRGLSLSNHNGSILFHGLNVGANIYF